MNNYKQQRNSLNESVPTVKEGWDGRVHQFNDGWDGNDTPLLDKAKAEHSKANRNQFIATVIGLVLVLAALMYLMWS